MSIKMTDVKMTKNVILSRQLYNTMGADKYEKFVSIAQQALEILSKIMNIPNNVHIRITCIKQGGVKGRYISAQKLVEIDPRRAFSYRGFIETLAHEMVHSEQYHEGRLAWSPVNRMFVWNNDLNKNKGTTYSRYRAQPWEVEAFGRQEELGAIVCRQLNI
jgi:hypothetical protein